MLKQITNIQKFKSDSKSIELSLKFEGFEDNMHGLFICTDS